jgi:hypothetical protein
MTNDWLLEVRSPDQHGGVSELISCGRVCSGEQEQVPILGSSLECIEWLARRFGPSLTTLRPFVATCSSGRRSEIQGSALGMQNPTRLFLDHLVTLLVVSHPYREANLARSP